MTYIFFDPQPKKPRNRLELVQMKGRDAEFAFDLLKGMERDGKISNLTWRREGRETEFMFMKNAYLRFRRLSNHK